MVYVPEVIDWFSASVRYFEFSGVRRYGRFAIVGELIVHRTLLGVVDWTEA
jgi:hypothetical protein